MLKENLEAFIKAQKELLNEEAYDFVNTYNASDSAYFSDAVAEFADGRCNIYYEDQRKYFYDNAEYCENALLELLDNESIADYIKKNGLDGLICYAGVCGQYQKINEDIAEQQELIIRIMTAEYCLNISEYLEIEEIKEIAENLIYIDRFDDIVDAVNEKIKGTAANE